MSVASHGSEIVAVFRHDRVHCGIVPVFGEFVEEGDGAETMEVGTTVDCDSAIARCEKASSVTSTAIRALEGIFHALHNSKTKAMRVENEQQEDLTVPFCPSSQADPWNGATCTNSRTQLDGWKPWIATCRLYPSRRSLLRI